MKSQISDALCVGRPLPLIPGDVSYLDVLYQTLDIHRLKVTVSPICIWDPCLPDLWVQLSTSHQDGHSTYNY